ncbi:hypothetical protein [Nesterenkonia sp. CF4.4]|uniref:hypothetical protein n=1 Tax=Nesterenkonia sp. CF4.4 TaxID=3373079 RepID=UPI003EE79438
MTAAVVTPNPTTSRGTGCARPTLMATPMASMRYSRRNHFEQYSADRPLNRTTSKAVSNWESTIPPTAAPSRAAVAPAAGWSHSRHTARIQIKYPYWNVLLVYSAAIVMPRTMSADIPATVIRVRLPRTRRLGARSFEKVTLKDTPYCPILARGQQAEDLGKAAQMNERKKPSTSNPVISKKPRTKVATKVIATAIWYANKDRDIILFLSGVCLRSFSV